MLSYIDHIISRSSLYGRLCSMPSSTFLLMFIGISGAPLGNTYSCDCAKSSYHLCSVSKQSRDLSGWAQTKGNEYSVKAGDHVAAEYTYIYRRDRSSRGCDLNRARTVSLSMEWTLKDKECSQTNLLSFGETHLQGYRTRKSLSQEKHVAKIFPFTSLKCRVRKVQEAEKVFKIQLYILLLIFCGWCSRGKMGLK